MSQTTTLDPIQCDFSKFNPMWLFKIQSKVAFQNPIQCGFSTTIGSFLLNIVVGPHFCGGVFALIFWGGGLCMQKQSGERCEVAKTWDVLALSRAETLEWRFARACIIMHKSFYVNPDVVARYGLLEVSRVLSTHPARAEQVFIETCVADRKSVAECHEIKRQIFRLIA